jgi:hypothetical protein
MSQKLNVEAILAFEQPFVKVRDGDAVKSRLL